MPSGSRKPPPGLWAGLRLWAGLQTGSGCGPVSGPAPVVGRSPDRPTESSKLRAQRNETRTFHLDLVDR